MLMEIHYILKFIKQKTLNLVLIKLKFKKVLARLAIKMKYKSNNRVI